MIEIKSNIDLKPYNTFGFSAIAKEFINCHNIECLTKALHYIKENNKPYFVIGGGSNVLFSTDYNGVIIHPTFSGIKLINEDDEHVWIEAGAGVVWDDLVEECVNNNWFGIENLSYIPGHVGASPVQNIGAYGVEVKDCIDIVKGIYIDSLETFELKNAECNFGYRQSIFKNELKNKTIITSVVFKLSKIENYNLTYGPVKDQVESKGNVCLRNIRQTITEIRKSKLPEPEELGNAGSFFKNPIIELPLFTALQSKYPNIPSYPINDDLVKVPAGWLIEQAGWKGKSIGDAGVHHQQALVLVNKGSATGKDIINLAQNIIKDVKSKFNITIEPEVNII